MSIEYTTAAKMLEEIERLRALVQQHGDEVWVGLKRAKDVRAGVIEECAKVALDYSTVCQAMPTSVIDSVCRGIAAAIRALKEKP